MYPKFALVSELGIHEIHGIHLARYRTTMVSVVNFIDALAKLLGAIAWPAAVTTIALVILRRHREGLDRLLMRTQSAKLPGGIELGFAALEEQKDRVVQAAEKVADAPADQRDAELDKLSKEYASLQKLQGLLAVVLDKKAPNKFRQESLIEFVAEGAERFPYLSAKTIAELDANRRYWRQMMRIKDDLDDGVVRGADVRG